MEELSGDLLQRKCVCTSDVLARSNLCDCLVPTRRHGHLLLGDFLETRWLRKESAAKRESHLRVVQNESGQNDVHRSDCLRDLSSSLHGAHFHP